VIFKNKKKKKKKKKKKNLQERERKSSQLLRPLKKRKFVVENKILQERKGL